MSPVRCNSICLREKKEAWNEGKLLLFRVLHTILTSVARHWAHDRAADIDTEGSVGRHNSESDGHDKLGLDFVKLDWSF